MSTYPFKITPNDPNFPLSDPPFNSRVELLEISPNNHKNYSLVAFRPGFPLQASELNEIQDLFYMNNTLTTSMYNLWMTSDTGETVFYGPGWLGATPLWPQKFMDPMNGPLTNLVEYQTIGETRKLIAKPGWYLIYMRQSGLKHWIYLTTELQSPAIVPTTAYTYVGFSVEYKTINAAADNSLYDNSSTNLVSNSPAGANRIKINIKNTTELSLTNDYDDDIEFCPIARIDTFNNVKYMNGKDVPQV